MIYKKIKNKISLIILAIPFLIFSQTNLRLNYNLTASGKNLSLVIGSTDNNENEVGIGLLYNINSIKHPDDQFNVFYKRMYATKTIHHFGFEGFYHKRILYHWKKVKPFLFYNIQFSYSSVRSRSFLPVGQDVNNGETLYKEYIWIYGPFLWIEQSIGIGYNAELNNNFFITSKLGFEIMFLKGKDEEFGIYENYNREFGYIFNFSIGYRFKAKSKRKI